jgi:phage host-nuclease inhibitor protein Gam
MGLKRADKFAFKKAMELNVVFKEKEKRKERAANEEAHFKEVIRGLKDVLRELYSLGCELSDKVGKRSNQVMQEAEKELGEIESFGTKAVSS